MRSFRLMALLAMCLMLLAAPVQAKTTITFWHGMGGELGEITDEMIKEFNASQDKYEVKGVYKGNYDEAMTAAIAAFREESVACWGRSGEAIAQWTVDTLARMDAEHAAEAAATKTK